jgi:hypothetical protein
MKQKDFVEKLSKIPKRRLVHIIESGILSGNSSSPGRGNCRTFNNRNVNEAITVASLMDIGLSIARIKTIERQIRSRAITNDIELIIGEWSLMSPHF